MAEDLSFDKVGSWPISYKAVFIAIVVVAIFISGYFVVIQPEQDALKTARYRESALKKEFESKQKKVANLEAYQKQMVQMREYFKALLKLLPSGTEVPDLIDDISRIALENGLKIKELDLQDEVQVQFYVELPIKISVLGSYHEISNFMSEVAKLPRIVTFHDFVFKHERLDQIKDLASVPSDSLTLDIIAKTYRYRGMGE